MNPRSGASRVIVAGSGVPFAGVLLAGGTLTGGLLAGGLLAGGVLAGGLLAGGVLAGGLLTGVLLAGGELVGVGTSVPASIAFCRAPSFVDTNGQPFPGPFKFWRVMEAALTLADLSCFESPVGKEILTEGLLTANPAWTFLIKACGARVRNNRQEIRDASHAQGHKHWELVDKNTES